MSEINKQEEVDYLEVDKPIPGQNYVCLSFVSPEKVLENKSHFFIKEFMKSLNNDFNQDDIEKKYDDFIYQNKDSLQKRFDDSNDGRTSIRGLKVRGIYDTRREAEVRAKVLQRMDKSFNVFVGQVGYWLPWDPEPDNIENQEYVEKDLNNLVKSYKDNETERDIYYQDQLEKRKSDIREENEKKKKENLKEQDTNNKQNEILEQIMNNEDHSELKKQFEKYNPDEEEK